MFVVVVKDDEDDDDGGGGDVDVDGEDGSFSCKNGSRIPCSIES